MTVLNKIIRVIVCFKATFCILGAKFIFSMNKKVFDYLVKLAKKGTNYITYTDLCLKCDLPFPAYSKKMFVMLEELTRNDDAEDRPFLTSFVVTKETNKPGTGFYELCHILGYEPFLESKNHSSFDEEERKRCNLHWLKKEVNA